MQIKPITNRYTITIPEELDEVRGQIIRLIGNIGKYTARRKDSYRAYGSRAPQDQKAFQEAIALIGYPKSKANERLIAIEKIFDQISTIMHEKKLKEKTPPQKKTRDLINQERAEALQHVLRIPVASTELPSWIDQKFLKSLYKSYQLIYMKNPDYSERQIIKNRKKTLIREELLLEYIEQPFIVQNYRKETGSQGETTVPEGIELRKKQTNFSQQGIQLTLDLKIQQTWVPGEINVQKPARRKKKPTNVVGENEVTELLIDFPPHKNNTSE